MVSNLEIPSRLAFNTKSDALFPLPSSSITPHCCAAPATEEVHFARLLVESSTVGFQSIPPSNTGVRTNSCLSCFQCSGAVQSVTPQDLQNILSLGLPLSVFLKVKVVMSSLPDSMSMLSSGKATITWPSPPAPLLQWPQ